jgi:hypothetical protein
LNMDHTLRGECPWEKLGKGRKPKLKYDWCSNCIGVNVVILNWQRPL